MDQELKTGVWEISWKCLPRAVFVQVNLWNVMDPFFGKLSICSWLQVSIECSHMWNRSLPKWEEICFDVQKRLRSYFEMLVRGCVCVNRFILWYGLVHCWNGYLSMLVGFFMVITWGRNQSTIVEEKLFLQVKNNFVQVLNWIVWNPIFKWSPNNACV